MRVMQESLYDSEATLRLVDRVLEDLDVPHCVHPITSLADYRTEQLRDEPVEHGQTSTTFLRAYWEIQEALERLRATHASLRVVPGAAARVEGDERARVSHALAMVDLLRSEEDDRSRGQLHEALSQELSALAEQLRCRESMSSRLDRTADLLCDLEVRLTHVSRAFDAGTCGFSM